MPTVILLSSFEDVLKLGLTAVTDVLAASETYRSGNYVAPAEHRLAEALERAKAKTDEVGATHLVVLKHDLVREDVRHGFNEYCLYSAVFLGMAYK
ncbi:MAG: hypothetical protein ACK5YK_00885 [Pseudomonadota bacterium]